MYNKHNQRSIVRIALKYLNISFVFLLCFSFLLWNNRYFVSLLTLGYSLIANITVIFLPLLVLVAVLNIVTCNKKYTLLKTVKLFVVFLVIVEFISWCTTFVAHEFLLIIEPFGFYIVIFNILITFILLCLLSYLYKIFYMRDIFISFFVFASISCYLLWLIYLISIGA